MSNKQATDRVRKQFAEISESPERLENLTRSLKKTAEEVERITEQLREGSSLFFAVNPTTGCGYC